MAAEQIKVGDIIPDVPLSYVPYDPNEDLKACPRPIQFKIHEQLNGKKAVIFAIPGPFTPTCSEQHVPGFIEMADQIKAKGVSHIICVSVMDGFVMNAFGKVSGSKDKVIMAGDGNAAFCGALGLTQDLTKGGMGVRSKRFAIVVDDLIVKYVGVEAAPGTTVSGADAILAKL
ncbi:peroxiredoxin type-2 [Umbelopsis nana]